MSGRTKLEKEVRRFMAHLARRNRRPTASERHRFNRYLARLVKIYRETHKLTEKEFAKEIGGTVKWVQLMEAEAYDITVLDIFWIAKFFNIEAVDLMKDGGL